MYSTPRTLSSGQTFYMKVILPPLWIGGFGFATVTLFFFPGFWSGASEGATNPGWKWFFLLTAIFGTISIWWSCIRLKRVRINDKALYISNYSNEITVPFANVATVDEIQWFGYRLVAIGFQTDTEFGSKIVFLPRIRRGGFITSQPLEHPVVQELRSSVHKATGRLPGGVAA